MPVTTAYIAYDGTIVDLLTQPLTGLDWDFPVQPMTDAYTAHLEAGGDPRSFSGLRHSSAPLTLHLLDDGQTDLSAVWRAGARLYWAEDDAPVRYCVLESAEPVRRISHGSWSRVTLTGTRGYAFSAKVDYAPQTGTCVGTFDFPGVDEDAVPGDPDIPALTALKAVYAQAVTFAAVGVRPDPGDAFDPIDDYSDLVDANALGGQRSAALTMTPAWQSVGTAPLIDTNDNIGRHALFARVTATHTTDANTRYRAASAVTGSAIDATTTAYGDAVTSTAGTGDGYEVAYLGEVNVPAGSVPDMVTGSAYETVVEGNSVTDGTLVITGNGIIQILQTFAGFYGEVVSVTYTVDSAPSFTPEQSVLRLTDASGTQLHVISANAPYTVGTHTIQLAVPYPITAGVTYGVSLTFSWVQSIGTVGLAYSNGDYADGELTTPYGTGESAGDDLTFAVTGRVPRLFMASTHVQATSTESSKTAALDYVVRVPTDAGALLWRPSAATSAGQGFYSDNQGLTRPGNIYLADDDGIGPSVLTATKRWGSVNLWPGVTNTIVSVAGTPAAAAPGDVTVTASAIGRYAALGSERPR